MFEVPFNKLLMWIYVTIKSLSFLRIRFTFMSFSILYFSLNNRIRRWYCYVLHVYMLLDSPD